MSHEVLLVDLCKYLLNYSSYLLTFNWILSLWVPASGVSIPIYMFGNCTDFSTLSIVLHYVPLTRITLIQLLFAFKNYGVQFEVNNDWQNHGRMIELK